MNEFRILFHEETNTYWTNSEDWKKLLQNSRVLYHYGIVDSDNIFVVKRAMNEIGYRMIKREEFKGSRLESIL